jgi:hypothetical protein
MVPILVATLCKAILKIPSGMNGCSAGPSSGTSTCPDYFPLAQSLLKQLFHSLVYMTLGDAF